MLTQEQEIEKSALISAFKDLESLAYQKRLEYLTAQVLPECALKTLKLQKLSNEEQALVMRFGDLMQEMIVKFGPGILEEII